MTTIAYKSGVMACDSQISGGFISTCPDKVILGKCAVGFTGDYVAGYQGALFLAGESQERPDYAEDDTEYIVVDAGKIWIADSRLRIAPIGDKFWSIGSGCAAAMAAMYMGASAEDAVKIAIKVDEYSGGKVRTYNL